MLRKFAIFSLLALLFSSPALLAADDETVHLLSEAWPNARATKISDVGRGIGVVFSPDLSVKDNCRFYQALGFACFQDTYWPRVLDDIHRYNELYPERRIDT